MAEDVILFAAESERGSKRRPLAILRPLNARP
jgi:hypothetical protein